jgi:hypothetical protein
MASAPTHPSRTQGHNHQITTSSSIEHVSSSSSYPQNTTGQQYCEIEQDQAVRELGGARLIKQNLNLNNNQILYLEAGARYKTYSGMDLKDLLITLVHNLKEQTSVAYNKIYHHMVSD